MEKVKFTIDSTRVSRVYTSIPDSEQSDEYVHAEVAEMMLDHLREIVEWLTNDKDNGRGWALEIAQKAIKKAENN